MTRAKPHGRDAATSDFRSAPATVLAFRNGSFTSAVVGIREDGRLAVSEGAAGAPPGGSTASPPTAGAGGIVLPGFVNGHSHAFQRVLRGRAEAAGDFWGWRERMYRAALALEPDDVRIAARAAYLEMLLGGFTGVAEFHYLHHAADGNRYGQANLMAESILAAAREAGIRVCLLTTAYARGGAGRELDPAQRRFADPSPDAFLARAEDLLRRIEELGRDAAPRAHAELASPAPTFGIALHSVRALPREWLAEIGSWASEREVPVHMHVAEQPAEVEACLAEHGRRPVELLADLGLLGPRFTAVHAIHVLEGEVALLASSGAGVCACPSTEANLADGFVPARSFLDAGVGLCIGTDSHASIDCFAELRELDYRERLRSADRAALARPERLLEMASRGGAERVGWGHGFIAPHVPADLVVLDEEHPALAGSQPSSLAAHLLLAGSPGMVRDVYVAGRRVIEGGRHPRQAEFLEEFGALQRRLWRDGRPWPG